LFPTTRRRDRPPAPPTEIAPRRVAIRCVWLHDSFSVRESSKQALAPSTPLFAPSLPLSHFHLSRTSKPSHGVQDRTTPDNTRPKPKDFLIPNGTRIHFSIILPSLPPACLPACLPCPALPPSTRSTAREIARPRLERQRGPVGRSVNQSVSQCSRSPSPHFLAPFLVEPAAAHAAALLPCPPSLAQPSQPASQPCPCHAMPCPLLNPDD
jgi:hypothetical protein